MDSDGDGTISLPEFQVAHERISRQWMPTEMAASTLEEMQAFMQGATRSISRQQAGSPFAVLADFDALGRARGGRRARSHRCRRAFACGRARRMF